MVQGEPLVTVLMATRGESPFLREALDSVLAQTYQNFELIVVLDGAATDSTLALYDDERIRIVRTSRKEGLTVALNRGLKQARGRFIARIDDDDIWVEADKLARQLSALVAEPRLGVIGTQNIVIDTGGRELYRWRVATDDAAIRRTLLRRNHFVHSGVVIRRAALEAVGGYDVSRRFAQDYDLWLRIGLSWRFKNLADAWVKQRVNPDGVTSRHNLQQYWSFLRTAFRYRHDYPGFWFNLPVYFREFLINLFPKSTFYRLGGALRRSRGQGLS